MKPFKVLINADLIHPAAVFCPRVKELAMVHKSTNTWRTSFGGNRLRIARKAFTQVALGSGMLLPRSHMVMCKGFYDLEIVEVLCFFEPQVKG